MSDSRLDDPALRSLAGGRLLAEITNRTVAFMREHYGARADQGQDLRAGQPDRLHAVRWVHGDRAPR
ncbi:MAG: hypothetical protein ACXVH3_36505 [Solirubrobacteraceae bacterium]